MSWPYRTSNGYYRWGFWTARKAQMKDYPFYHGSIVTKERDFELALKRGREWAAELRKYRKNYASFNAQPKAS